jgi:hypothetical protein
MISIETQRKNIQDWIEDYQTTDSYDIGNAKIDWLSGRQQWQLTLPNGEIEREDNGCGDLISMIDDADIMDYHPSIAEYFEEEAAE